MDEKTALLHEIGELLPQVNALLLQERGEARELPEEPRMQWDLFRALVNTRPPVPAADELIALQDRLLQGILAYRGTTELDDIPAIADRAHMRIWRGDITTLAVDAIVNAANSQMLGCFVPGHFCIDNAIHTFAGMQLRLECARLMEEQGFSEPTGMAKLTDAFNLPSKHVIHTVGPIAGGQPSELDRALLANCYAACLDAAADAGCASIALCCISTGVFGFPQAEAANIAVQMVDRWLAYHDEGIEVIFNVFKEADETIYHDVLSSTRRSFYGAS